MFRRPPEGGRPCAQSPFSVAGHTPAHHVTSSVPHLSECLTSRRPHWSPPPHTPKLFRRDTEIDAADLCPPSVIQTGLGPGKAVRAPETLWVVGWGGQPLPIFLEVPVFKSNFPCAAPWWVGVPPTRSSREVLAPPARPLPPRAGQRAVGLRPGQLHPPGAVAGRGGAMRPPARDGGVPPGRAPRPPLPPRCARALRGGCHHLCTSPSANRGDGSTTVPKGSQPL